MAALVAGAAYLTTDKKETHHCTVCGGDDAVVGEDLLKETPCGPQETAHMCPYIDKLVAVGACTTQKLIGNRLICARGHAVLSE